MSREAVYVPCVTADFRVGGDGGGGGGGGGDNSNRIATVVAEFSISAFLT